jgi:MFS family permease
MKISEDKKAAIQLIVLFGMVSLFGDIVYEGARSVNGPFLKTLGANAAVVGLVAGIGEFMGYAIRLFSGYYADRTKAYWVFTFVGYSMLVSVPMLSLTGVWQTVAVFIVLERVGKALRSPAKDTIVSQATKQVGTGFGFGLQEAMDQIGAIAGPLIFTLLFVFIGGREKTLVDYQRGYALLWIPFLLVILCVILAYIKVPNPERLESSSKNSETEKLSKVFWLYNLFSFIGTLGFVNFVLMSYHFKARGIIPDSQIPLFYAVAMAVDGAFALIIGKVYDVLKSRNNHSHGGLYALITLPLFSIPIPILGFSNSYKFAIAGVLLWGIVMGIQETIMKSAIADLTPLRKRGTGYGIFNTSYGLAMFLGSAFMGFLYDFSVTLLVICAVALEIIAIPLFFIMKRNIEHKVSDENL